MNDFATTDSVEWIPIDVISNDVLPAGTTGSERLEVRSLPLHGKMMWLSDSEWAFGDDGSPVGYGWGGPSTASFIHSFVPSNGQVQLQVSGVGDWQFTGSHDQSGDYRLFVSMGRTLTPDVYDFRFDRNLVPEEINSFMIPNQQPGAEFVAWIDNLSVSVLNGEAREPNTQLRHIGGPEFLYKPEPGYRGKDTFTYTILDDEGGESNEALVTVTVNNLRPVAADDGVNTQRDKPVAVNVLANDVDPDGTINRSTLTVIASPRHGRAVVQQTASGPVVRYAPAVGFTGIDSFRYTVRDREGAVSREATASVFVFSKGPRVGDDSAVTEFGNGVSVNVLSNDAATTSPIDPKSLAIVSGPLHGTAILRPTEHYLVNQNRPNAPDSLIIEPIPDDGRMWLQVSGDPDSAFTGAHRRTEDYTLLARLVDPITPGNSFFDRSDSQFHGSLRPGKVDTFMVSGLDPYLIAVEAWFDASIDAGTRRMFMRSLAPRIEYVPDPDFSGTDTFTYAIKDEHGRVSNLATVTVVVKPDPDLPPFANYDSAETNVNESVWIDVLGNDQDNEDELDSSSLVIARSSLHGTLRVKNSDAGLRVLYTPDRGYVGYDSFTYQVSDKQGQISDDGVVIIHVLAPPVVPPIAVPDFADTTENRPATIDVLANDEDPDSVINPATLVVVGGPSNGVVRKVQTSTGASFVYTPKRGTRAELVVSDWRDIDDGIYSAGHLSLREAIKLANADEITDTFTYTVRDQNGILSNTSTVTVHVRAQPTTITFAAGLMAGGRRTLNPTRIGDTSDGNSALVISSPITLLGPAADHRRITLAGQGKGSDLRAFLVTVGGNLTLRNLNLSNWVTDGSGAAVNVAFGGRATLVNCQLSRNDAYDRGGAISNFGSLWLTNVTSNRNHARNGGALYNFGSATIVNSTFTGNDADEGGGFFNVGQVELTGSTLNRNRAVLRGGGFLDEASSEGTSLQGTEITRNQADEGGGFFVGLQGIVSLSDSRITENTARRGGGFSNGAVAEVFQLGIDETAGFINATRTVISANVAAEDGGGFFTQRGHRSSNANPLEQVTISLYECRIENNQADRGGGLFATTSGLATQGTTRVSLVSTTFAHNRARQGGGVYNDLAVFSVKDTTFSHNTAKEAGGGFFNNSGASLKNTTFAGNTALQGGGLYIGFGNAQVVDSTFTDNRATQGGGLYNDRGYVSLVGVIVAGNRRRAGASDIGGPTPVNRASSSHNLIGTGGSGGLVANERGNVVGVAPLLGRLGNYGGLVATIPLLPGSPAINAAIGTEGDARGVAPIGKRDIGAFESHGFVVTAISGSGQSARSNQRFKSPLRVRVRAVDSTEPVGGGRINFVVPNAGPTARLKKTHALIGRNGAASVTARANRIGGTYQVMATAAGATSSVKFTLKNLAAANRKSDSSIVLVRTTAASPSQSPGANSVVNVSPAKIEAAYPEMVPKDLTEYRLNARHQLLRRQPRAAWAVLMEGVASFKKAPNGNLYVLTNRQELKQLKLGVYWSTLQTGVQGMAMDGFGSVHLVDELGGISTIWSPDRFNVLPPIPIGETEVPDPPSDQEVVEAAGIVSKNDHWYVHLFNDIQYFASGPDDPHSNDNRPHRELAYSPYNNIRIVKEPIVNTIYSPRDIAGVGLVQLHRVQYKCTIYLDMFLWDGIGHDSPHARSLGQAQYMVFIDHDHLHRYVPGAARANSNLSASTATAVQPARASSVSAVSNAAGSFSDIPADQRVSDNFVQRLVTAPNGTIYSLGGVFDGYLRVGTEAGPYALRGLAGSGVWQPLDIVYDFSIGKDSTLYALDAQHRLRELPSNTNINDGQSAARWITLVSNVENFALTADGDLYALTANHTLQRLAKGATSWAVVETDVRAFTADPQGHLYLLNGRQELRTLVTQRRWRTLDTGVKSIAMTNDGAVYELNGRGELKRLRSPNHVTKLASSVRDFHVTLDGRVYALTNAGVLNLLTPRDHWTAVKTGVRQFQFSPNGDLYLINESGELQRQKLGYSWMTLQTNAVSLNAYSNGSVDVFDTSGRRSVYNSLGPYYLLAGSAGILNDVPTEGEIVAAAQIDSPRQYFPARQEKVIREVGFDTEDSVPVAPGDSSLPRPRLLYASMPLTRSERKTVLWIFSITTELLLETVDAPRFIPGIGLVSLHRAQFVSKVVYATDDGVREELVYFDLDHLHSGYQAPSTTSPSVFVGKFINL